MARAAQDRPIRLLHTAVTAQFAASAALIIGWTLYEAGLKWWALFSLSAQALVVVVFGVLIYGFAVFRGAAGERIEAEHPLSGSVHYRFFYATVPMLGGVCVGLDYLLAEGLVEGIRGFALGTVITAYVVWLFVDAAVAIVESALPESRNVRAQRQAVEREHREAFKREKERLIDKFRAEWKATLERLRPLLDDRAGELVALLAAGADNPSHGADRAASIGLEIWQEGGMECMKELFALVESRCAAMDAARLANLLNYWWDGVAEWRAESAPGGPQPARPVHGAVA